METHIAISMALDNNYIYPTIVSIISVMENQDENTACDFYIMHTPDLEEMGKKRLLSLREDYKGCSISLIDMGEKYKDAKSDAHISAPAYYRLSLPELLPDLDRIIWLDGDTLTFGDLTEMFNLDMEGYHFKGFLDYPHLDNTSQFGIYNDHYICSGVMLINLKELRRDNAVAAFEGFIAENNDRLYQHDQTVINTVSYKKTGVLPAKFGVPNNLGDEEAVQYVRDILTPLKYTVEEFMDARAGPVILHCWAKPWVNGENSNDWWKYAGRCRFYEEIKQRYG